MFPNDLVTTTQTIYIWAAVGTCTDQSTFIVTVNQTPVLVAPSDVTACDSYTLQAPAQGGYFSTTGGVDPITGPITSSQTVYWYAETATTPNCSAEVSFQVTINTSPVVDEMGDVAACDSYTLPVLTSGAYYSQSGGVGPLTGPLTTTQTVYIWASNGSCSDEDSFVVTINATPAFTIDAGCQGSAYMLTVVPSNGFDPATADYAWSAGSSGVVTGSGQSVEVSGADTYSVTVSLGECSTTLSVGVDATGCLIQKGISPNADGYNDYFDLEGQNVAKLQIFNRYGMVVYDRANYTNQWKGQTNDGEELPDGTYYYVIDRAAGEARTGWIYINRNSN